MRKGSLASRPRNSMTFADGACEARSRSKEKVMQGHRRRRATQRSPATPISPKGGGGTASILCRSSSTMSQTSRRRCFANSTPSRSPQTSWYSWDETLTRTMHKFSTSAPKSSGVLHRLCDPQAGAPGLLNVLQGIRLRGPPVAHLVRSALSLLRDENPS